jgi:hypothetical protein
VVVAPKSDKALKGQQLVQAVNPRLRILKVLRGEVSNAVSKERLVLPTMSRPCTELPKTHSSMFGFLVALLLVDPAAAVCGRVHGVFCNGGICAAGSCQCPSHLVGPNWSVFEDFLLFLVFLRSVQYQCSTSF